MPRLGPSTEDRPVSNAMNLDEEDQLRASQSNVKRWSSGRRKCGDHRRDEPYPRSTSSRSCTGIVRTVVDVRAGRGSDNIT